MRMPEIASLSSLASLLFFLSVIFQRVIGFRFLKTGEAKGGKKENEGGKEQDERENGMKNRKTRPNPLANARLMLDGKKAIPVDAAVEWAFCQELPKAPPVAGGPAAMRTGYGSILDYGELGTRIDHDAVNRFGCVVDLSSDDFPCDDAIAIGEAVLGLDGLALTLPEDWNPAPELEMFDGLGAKAVAEAVRKLTVRDAEGDLSLKLAVPDLVIGRAILPAGEDDTGLGPVTRECERHADGREKWFVKQDVWTIAGVNPDGTDRTVLQTIDAPGTDKRGHPKPGAFRRFFLDPDPVPAIIARAEHEIWHSALTLLAEDLAGRLDGYHVTPPLFSARPWEEAAPIAPRVLPDLQSEYRLAALRDGLMRRRFPAWFARQDRAAARLAEKSRQGGS